MQDRATDIHFSLTPRLVWVGAGSLLALLVLVFLLGFELGRPSGPPEVHLQAPPLPHLPTPTLTLPAATLPPPPAPAALTAPATPNR